MEEVDDSGRCVVHPALPSVGVCPRCGRFRCARCAEDSPCLECQQRAFTAPGIPGYLSTVILVLLVSYGVCEAIGLATFGLQRELVASLSGGDALSKLPLLTLLLAWGCVYLLVWLGLIIAFLAWYAYLLGWAEKRGAVRAWSPAAAMRARDELAGVPPSG